MKDFKECSYADYKRALSQKDCKNLNEISNEYLYILYTKYRHDYCTIPSSGSYALDISISTKCKAELYEKELKRRGIL